MDLFTPDELQEAGRPIASLMSKSEKAQQKLAPGTWQHAMLRDNLKALRLASALMNEGSAETDPFTREDLEEARRAVVAMISRAEKARAKFAPGTSQDALQRNRIKALSVAEAMMKNEIGKRNG